MAKHCICFYTPVTVRDRAICGKSLYLDTVTGVSKQCKSFAIFGKIFSKSPKMAAIFGEGKIFAKNGKTQICFYLLRSPVRDRAIFVEIARSRTVKEYLRKFVIFAIFGKKFSKIPKNGRHFWGFSNFFAKNGKTQICFYLLRYPVRDRAISTKSLDLAQGI